MHSRDHYGSILLTAALSVFMSKVVWYDLRTVFPFMNTEPVIRTLFAVYAVALLPFIALAYTRGFHLLACSWTLLIYTVANILGLFNALAQHADVSYMLQDTYKMCFLPAGFLLAICFPPKSVGALLRRLAMVVLLFQAMRLCINIAFATKAMGYVFGGVCDLYPAAYFGVAASREDGKNRKTDAFYLLLSLALVFPGQKRTLYITIPIMACFVAYYFYSSLLRKKWVYGALGCVLVAILAVPNLQSRVLQLPILKRVTTTDVNHVVGDESRRQEEVTLVYEELDSRPASAFWLGLGNGATYTDYSHEGTHGSAQMHHAHFTPAAMHLRYGIAGWFVYIWSVGMIVFHPKAVYGSWLTAADDCTMRVFGLGIFLSSITMFGAVDDLALGAMLGLMYYGRFLNVSRHKRTRSQPARPLGIPATSPRVTSPSPVALQKQLDQEPTALQSRRSVQDAKVHEQFQEASARNFWSKYSTARRTGKDRAVVCESR